MRIIKKRIKGNITRYSFFGITFLKKKRESKWKKVYFLGIKIFKKRNKTTQNCCNECISNDSNDDVLNKELVRLEGFKILKNRENIFFGDKI